MGWNPLDDLNDMAEDFKKDPLGSALNLILQVHTGGLAGYDNKKGEIIQGSKLHAIDEGIGEISGRNMARKAQMDTKDAIAEEKIRLANQAKEELNRRKLDDQAASSAAGAARSKSLTQSSTYLGGAQNDPSKDFLGL